MALTDETQIPRRFGPRNDKEWVVTAEVLILHEALPHAFDEGDLINLF